ncbi:MAG TPA: hypothetical protein VF170_15635, partial [Planctomycetaceae bacterium]
RFDVTYRAEYVPDEIRSGRPATQVEGGFAVPAVGPLPVDLADWRFELDAQRRHLQARDPYGRVRWKLDVRPPAERDGPLRNIASAQVRACGHLLAFAAGTTLVVIDLSRPGEPRALWSRDLLDRRFADFAINRRILGEPRLGTPGLIGFAGAEALLYQSGSTVTAADPVTGETLWQRTGVPFGCELSGDDEFVVIQPPGGVEAFVGRIADGGEAAFRRTADHQQRLAWHGTRLVSWTATADGTRLACRDVAREADLWSYDFPNGTKLSTAPPGEAAVLDPKTGRLRVVRFEDGRTLLDAEIDADPSVERIQLLRSFGRTLLLTRRAGRTNVERNAGLFESNGLAYAFDDAGRRLWSAAVTGLNAPLEQPAGLPVLYLAATIHAPDRPPSHRAAVLDVRTGRLLVDQKRERQLLPFEFRTDAGTGSVTIAVPDGRFVLTPADEPLPTPRAEGPGDLPKAAPAATPAAPVPAP